MGLRIAALDTNGKIIDRDNLREQTAVTQYGVVDTVSGRVILKIGIDGSVTGGELGASAADAVGFYGHAKTAQPAGAAQAPLTDSTGGTPSTTVAAITADATYAQADLVAVKNGLASIIALVNALRSALVAEGLIKGGA